MTGDFARYLLAVVLVIGVTGNVIGPQTVAEFSDSHDGEGTFAAVSNFNSGGGPGGGGGGAQLVADAGGPYTVDEGASVELDPWDSTATRGIQSASWTITSGSGEINTYFFGLYTEYAAADAIDGDAQVIIELTITDRSGRTDTDSATVTVRDVDGSTGGETSGIQSTSGTADESTSTTTPSSSATATETTTETSTPSSTETVTESQTSTSTETDTETPTTTATETDTSTATSTATETETPVTSPTATETETTTATESGTATETATATETETATPTATATDTETATATATETETATATPQSTATEDQ